MRRWLVLVAVMVLVAGVAWWRSQRDGAKRATTAPVLPDASSAAAGAGEGGPAGAGDGGSGARVKRVSPERRRDLAARITAAHAARVARAQGAEARSSGSPGGAPPAAHLDDVAPPLTTEEVLQELLAVMPELRDQVTECQTRHAPQVTSFKARLSLTGDHDLGTVIDASELEDPETGAPLPPAFDDCVRDRMQTLELLPMSTRDTFSASIVFDLTGGHEEADERDGPW